MTLKGCENFDYQEVGGLHMFLKKEGNNTIITVRNMMFECLHNCDFLKECTVKDQIILALELNDF